MNKKEKALKCVEILKNIYPSAECALQYNGDPWRLLVMGRLSAQCTDARVNQVCVELFEKIPNVYAMAEAELADIEKMIFSCGLYKTKAQSLKGMAQRIVTYYNGDVPSTMDELLTLPGVGRKIANLILGDIYHQPAIVADTHCIRISARLGLCGNGKPCTPEKTETELKKIIPPAEQSDFCHRIVWFGRDVCKAINPQCDACPLGEYCVNKKK